MTTATAAARASESITVRSREADRLTDELLRIPPWLRRQFLGSLDLPDFEQVLATCRREMGTPYALWRDDPAGFTEDVLGETTWSKQREILSALPEHKIVAVPAGYGVGKTHIAARAAIWRVCCWPPGGAHVVSTATRMRQVRALLWPHIRQVHGRCGLPGTVDMTQWKIPDRHGTEVVVAEGFTSPANDEVGAAGIHYPNLFLIVDEAGGVGHVLGKGLRGVMAGKQTKVLLIGNPPTDEERSWFEDQCEKETIHVIRIAAVDSPNVTGEPVSECRTCPEGSEPHTISEHVTEQEWVDETIDDYGDESNFVQSKVYARFPKGGASRAIPSTWVEQAMEWALVAAEQEAEAAAAGEPEWTHDPIRRGDDPSDGEPFVVQPFDGAWVRLGVDVASDGGDELVVSRAEGDVVRVVHTSSGPANENAVHVSGVILREIERAERVRQMLGTTAPIRVKIDAIGVGWGVASVLEAWKSEQRHSADIVRVVVSERGEHKPDKETFRPGNKRAEMWLAGRSLLQPDAEGRQGLRLDIDRKTAAQLSGPTYYTNTQGETLIEPKKKVKGRGLKSPDRGEAVLLAVYEPKARRRKRVIG